MSKVYVGRQVSDISTPPAFDQITKVILKVDADNAYVAGDDTGRVMEADCPYATQAMANTLLSQLSSILYRPMAASEALMDPAAEIGDGVTVGGVYTVLAQIDTTFDQLCASDIAAPGQEEIESEYSFQTEAERIAYQLASTRSLISKTAEEIRLEVQNEVEGLAASITVQLDSITSRVAGAEGNISTLEQTATSLQSQIEDANGNIAAITQKVDNITLSVSNKAASSTISLSVDGVEVSSETIRFTGDVVFESDLAAGNTVVSGACITTGRILADYIKLGGAMDVYKSTESIQMGGYLGYITSRDYEGNRTHGMGMMDPDEDYQVVVTDAGARITSPTAEVVAATNVTLQTDHAVNVYASRFTSDVELTTASDRRAKEEIAYDVETKYLSLFDRLRPASFLFKGKEAKRHLGFIAQDVEAALLDSGLGYDALAALDMSDPSRYGIAYGEFVALLTAKLQKLEKEVEALKLWKS